MAKNVKNQKSCSLDLSQYNDKIALIKFYLSIKGVESDVESMILDQIGSVVDKLYKKYVPKDVRFMMENKEIIENGGIINKSDIQSVIDKPEMEDNNE